MPPQFTEKRKRRKRAAARRAESDGHEDDEEPGPVPAAHVAPVIGALWTAGARR